MSDEKKLPDITTDEVDAMVDGLFERGIRMRDSGDKAGASEMLRTGMRMFRNDFKLRMQHRDLKATNAELEAKSETDALTGLPSLAGFNRAMKHEISELRRFDSHGIALVYVDLDGFKAINDTFGHDMGDKVLKEVAKRLQESFRTTDIVCRIGGDELNVIMPFRDNNHFEPGQIKEFIRDALAGLYVWDEEGQQPYPIGASIGIASSRDPELEDISEVSDIMLALKKTADARMYQDKWRNGEYTEENKNALFHPKNERLEVLRVKARALHEAALAINGPAPPDY